MAAVLWGSGTYARCSGTPVLKQAPALLPPDAEATELVYAGEADGFLE